MRQTAILGLMASTALAATAHAATAPVLTFSLSPATITAGGSTSLVWSSTNATSCAASGGYTRAGLGASGSQLVPNETRSTTFTMTCTGAGGTVSKSNHLQVNAASSGTPTVTFTLSPDTITAGGSTTLIWSSTNATSCAASGGYSRAGLAPSGSQLVPNETRSTTFTMSCTGAGGSVSKSDHLTVNAGSGTSNGYIKFADSLPAAGSSGTDAVPTDGALEDTSHPDHVIGNGTPSSCTSAAVVAAVKLGGVITFDCGSAPVTIQMTATAKVFNNAANKIVIDGGGLVTLNGANQRRILYMNTCDSAQVYTTAHCDNQQYPQMTVQNITFTAGNASKESTPEGGAIYATGGRFKAVNTRFFNNICATTGPDTAGGAIYAFEEYQSLPVNVVHSTFGGASNLSNACSNGAALGSVGVSWNVVNSLLSYNRATGNGGNPANAGTPGGGSGGAIYNDGNTMTLTVAGSTLEYNQVIAFGSAIFFVSNNLTGNIVIKDSTIMGNIGGSWYPKYPQISAPDSTPISVSNSVISN